MKTIKIIAKTLIFMFILLSSCVIIRNKKLAKLLTKVETEPKSYCFTLKTKITDFLSVNAKIGNQINNQNFMFDTGSPLTYSFKAKDSFNIITKKLFRLGKYKFDYGSGSITLGDVKFNNVGYLVTDYAVLEYLKELQGIVGSSILQTSICEINFAIIKYLFKDSIHKFFCNHLNNNYK